MICCLHGFLGCGDDWEPLRTYLEEKGLGEVVTPDLFARPETIRPLREWSRGFVEWVSGMGQKPFLLGYSMGGRLAMHALLEAPRMWSGAVIVSAGLGLEDPREREARRERDLAWSHRFLEEDWGTLLGAWQGQALFAGRPMPAERSEEDFDRTALARALRLWSPGVQDPLLSRLGELDLPLLWVVGGDDEEYVSVSRRVLEVLPRGRLWVVPGAAHRVPWEAREAFNRGVSDFIEG